jgi:single-stranded-DNA-specific exonuclease
MPSWTRSHRLKKNSWNLLAADSELSNQLSKDFALHPVVARVLAARGWNQEGEALGQFLDPKLKNICDPYSMKEMELAVERTVQALKNKEKICIYGDYDVDGVSASALLAGTLQFLGARPQIVIPHRFNDGYGMSVTRVEELGRQGIQLIITVDNGVTAIDPIKRATELGIDVVVTDHHLAGDALPEVAALLNPNRPDAQYPGGALCGAGVAFKFAHALLKKASPSEVEGKKFLLDQLDLVALGTIADVVPLVGENRIFARHGLEKILQSKRPGIQALLEVSGYTARGSQQLNPEMVGFGLGPRINAAGRTDDATRAFELLLTTDPAKAQQLATHLEHLNRERQKIEKDILEESICAVEELDQEPSILVVGGQGWHLGVVGIVAARLAEKYSLPAIVLTFEEDLARGSARSIPGFDVYQALKACSSHLVKFGGHAAAAGLQISRNNIEEFRNDINEYTAKTLTEMGEETIIDVDAEVKASEMNWDLFNSLQKLQPFGEGNAKPMLMMRGVKAAYPPKVVGRDHLRVKISTDQGRFDAIGFSLGRLKEIFESSAPLDILFRPRENTYNGNTSLEMQLFDARIG